jgi:hypothetical protein
MQHQQPDFQTYQQQQYQSKHDFQNPYFRFMDAIKSPETKKRYPDRFKAFLDYIQIPGTNIEERLVNFYNQANQNPPWLQSSLMSFLIFQKERVIKGDSCFYYFQLL